MRAMADSIFVVQLIILLVILVNLVLMMRIPRPQLTLSPRQQTIGVVFTLMPLVILIVSITFLFNDVDIFGWLSLTQMYLFLGAIYIALIIFTLLQAIRGPQPYRRFRIHQLINFLLWAAFIAPMAITAMRQGQ